MPRPSDALPRAPARRRRPERRRHRSPGRPSSRTGALFLTVITSPHNENLTQVRKLAGRKWRDKLGEFVAEGEDLVAAADAAGWPAVAAARGRRLRARRVRRSRRSCSPRSPSSARAPGRSPSTRSAGPPSRPGRCASRCGGSTTPATSGTVLRSALAFGAAQRRARPGDRRSRTARRRCAPRWARSSPSRSCKVRGVDALPGRRVALVPRDGRPLAEVTDARRLARGRRRARGPARQRCSRSATRPATSRSRSESLNAAMAATVAMYEVSR